MSLRAAPKISASMFESALYNIMGGGLTDRLFLLGHADGLALNEPYQVMSMNDAIVKMQSDTESPLVKGLLEAFLAGARDIWIMAVAPMSEYEPDLNERTTAYYDTYNIRLQQAYEILNKWDIPQFVVPLDAPFNSQSDFLTPLAQFCMDVFNTSGEVVQGFLGTRGDISEELAQVMALDNRLSGLGESGQFVAVFAGDLLFNLKMMPTAHTSSAIACIAGQLSATPLYKSIVNKPLKNAANPVGADLKSETIELLAEAGVNTIGRRIRGRRGEPFQVVAFTDNTLAEPGSDYWSIFQVRLISRIVSEIRSLGYQQMGQVGYGIFKQDVEDYLMSLTSSDQIRGYSLDIYRSQEDPYRVYVDLSVSPYFGVRQIHVITVVGPQQGATTL